MNQPTLNPFDPSKLQRLWLCIRPHLDFECLLSRPLNNFGAEGLESSKCRFLVCGYSGPQSAFNLPEPSRTAGAIAHHGPNITGKSQASRYNTP